MPDKTLFERMKAAQSQVSTPSPDRDKLATLVEKMRRDPAKLTVGEIWKAAEYIGTSLNREGPTCTCHADPCECAAILARYSGQADRVSIADETLMERAREICATLAEDRSEAAGQGRFGGEVYRDGMCDDQADVQAAMRALSSNLGHPLAAPLGVKVSVSKDWCERMAHLEGDSEVGVGFESIDAALSSTPTPIDGWKKIK